MKWLFKIFRKTKKEKTRIYPPSVLHALNHKDCIFGKDELISLTQYGFLRESYYLYIRLLAKVLKPFQIKDILEESIKMILEGDVVFKTYLLSKLELLDKEEITGIKLAQISRQGFDFWYQRYEDKIQQYLSQKVVPTIVAFAPLVGMPSFVKLSRFNILDPNLLDTESDFIGYRILILSKEDVVVYLIKRNENLHGTVLDDVQKTGAKRRKIEEYAKRYNWSFKFDCLCLKEEDKIAPQ